MDNLRIHSISTQTKLAEARKSVKLFAFDYDGTIYDGCDFKFPEVIPLIEKIMASAKSVSLSTARAASAVKTFVPPLKEFLIDRGITEPIFIGGGNGAILYELKRDELKKIYNHGLNFEEIIRIINEWEKVCGKFEINTTDLAENGLETFRKFLSEDRVGYIPDEILNLCRPYEGKIFTEEAKVTFVLPKDEIVREKIISEIKNELGGEYSVVAGDKTFCHITKKLQEDGKVVAVKTILEIMGLDLNQVATFGDMPTGNDAGLLSFPFSFTNSYEFIKEKNNFEQSPYILIDSDLTPVARIYDAVDYLLA